MSETDFTDLGLGVPEKASPKKNEKTPAPLHKGKKEYAAPFYTVNIANVEHMPDYEIISVNGEAIQMERGLDIPNIPEAFVSVLRNAIASRQVTRRRSDQTEYAEWVPYPSIPYQIIAGPYNERKPDLLGKK
jgi:hypothetical protein